MNLKNLIKVKEKADNLYHEFGESDLTDKEYDQIVDQIQKIDPENPTLFRVGFSTSSKTKLPVPLGSLSKIKTEKELRKWCKYNTDYVITPKLDGISILTKYVNGYLVAAYTRGDGLEGRDIYNYQHPTKLNVSGACNIPPSIPKNIQTDHISDTMLVRGELIIKDEIFESKYKIKGFKNARNLVASVFNRKKQYSGSANNELSDLLNDIDYIVYEKISNQLSKKEQLVSLQTSGFLTVPFLIVNQKDVTINNLSNYLDTFRNNFLYSLDGVVIDISDSSLRRKLGFEGSSINPAYAKAYKVRTTDNEFVTTVESIEWNVSRLGFLKPRVKVTPVDIKGCTINWLTGKNAKYIKDNKIASNSSLLITRSGDTIPDIIRNLSDNSDADLPISCPSCGNELVWNDSKVELVCYNSNCYQKKLKELSFFFVNLGVFGISEDRIKIFYDNGFDSVEKILTLTIDKISNIRGFGITSGQNIVTAIHNACQNITIAKLMTCTGFFEKLAEKKIQMVLDNILLKDLQNIDNLHNKIMGIKGFSSVSTNLFLKGLTKFIVWYDHHQKYFKIQK